MLFPFFRHCQTRCLSGSLVLFASATLEASATSTREVFKGVTHIERTDWPSIPRPILTHILLIDLGDADIRFRLTEPDTAVSEHESYTRAESTLDYLKRVKAQVAINAHFGVGTGQWPLLKPRFLAVSDGDRYSRIEGAEPALNIDANNVARIIVARGDPPTYETSPTVNLFTSIGGNDRLVLEGKNSTNAGDGKGYYSPRARTVVGLTRDHKTLVVITVDEGRPETQGVTPPESAELLLEYDVWDGINLDGGGSTSLAMADPNPRLVNVPNAGGTPRSLVTNLAIFAAPASPAEDD